MTSYCMSNVEKVTRETIEKGGILALLYFDLHGKDKDKLVNLGAGFVRGVLKEPGVVYAVGEVSEPIEQDKVISTSIELKVLCDSFLSISNLCSKYSPFSIEIIRPDKINLTIDVAHEVLMNLATTTFEYKKYILERISSPEELEVYKTSLNNKILVGKAIREKKGETK